MAAGRGAFEETVPGYGPARPAVFLIELAPLGSPELLATAIASAVGLTFFPGSDPKAQLLAYLRDKSALLVLDNFEHCWTERRWSTRSSGRRAARGSSPPRASGSNLGAETVFGLDGDERPDPVRLLESGR